MATVRRPHASAARAPAPAARPPAHRAPAPAFERAPDRAPDRAPAPAFDSALRRPRVDLNLLYVFDAVMTERHVTRAAERLGMTQSAVSNALARLRKAFEDQLFVKAPRGVDATPRALALWPRIHQMLEELQESIQPSVFEAQRSQRQFRIALVDVTASLLAPYLHRAVFEAAPQASLFFVPHDPARTGAMLMRGELDFAIGINPARAAVVESMPLFSDSWVVAARRGHPLLKRKLALAAYCAAPHLAVNESGDPAQPDIVGESLAQAGLGRNVCLTVNQFSVVAAILRTSSLIATLPARMAFGAAAAHPLATQPLPFAVPDAVVYLSWHQRSASSPPLRWLKQRLLEAVTALNLATEQRLRLGAAAR